MICEPCKADGIKRTALYQAGRHGFCREHRDEAVKATRALLDGTKVLRMKEARRESNLSRTWGWRT
jgi:hypothetical protein